MVISVDPDPDILESPTGIDSTWESSEDLYIIIFPLSASTASLNVKTILALTPIPVAPSVGTDDDKVGAPISAVVKLSVVASEIPAYELLELSSNAVAAI